MLLAFDPEMSKIYLLILFADFIWYVSDNFVSFKFSRDGNVQRGVISAAIGLAAFLVASTALLSYIPGALSLVRSNMQSIFELLSATTPILQNSKILTIIGWVVLIPYIETSFFNGRLLEGIPVWLKEKAGMNSAVILTDPNKDFMTKITNPASIFVIFLVAAAFTLFHLSAKGLQSIPLLITFIFSIISSLIVIKDRELRGAIYLHVAVNGITVLTSYGVLG